MDVKNCTVCNIKIDEDNYKKDRNICKNCYNMNRKKCTINTFYRTDNIKEKRKVVHSVNYKKINKKKRKVIDSVKNNNNRTLIIIFSKLRQNFLIES